MPKPKWQSAAVVVGRFTGNGGRVRAAVLIGRKNWRERVCPFSRFVLVESHPPTMVVTVRIMGWRSWMT